MKKQGQRSRACLGMALILAGSLAPLFHAAREACLSGAPPSAAEDAILPGEACRGHDAASCPLCQSFFHGPAPQAASQDSDASLLPAASGAHPLATASQPPAVDARIRGPRGPPPPSRTAA